MKKSPRPIQGLAMKPTVIATAVALSLVMSDSAFAQAAAPAAAEKVEKIEVTGSRVPIQNVEGASPITTIDANTIKVDGVRNVESLLNNLPQVVADFGGTVSNGATGTATVNLRNLGNGRTLVLVNGRRLPAGSPLIFAADLNQIPAPLIKRVEVLTGGASAVYGSDAVAGVVNFIMNDRFEGVQLEFNQSFNQHSQKNELGRMISARALGNSAEFALPDDKSADGKIYDANILMGANFANNKGNFTLYLGYNKQDALLQSERDFSACSIGGGTSNTAATINGVAFGPGFRCGGSGTSFPGQFRTAAGFRTVADANGGTRAFGALDLYNFGPTNYFQRPDIRYTANATANYDISEFAKVYADFNFHDDRTVAQIAPSGLFGLPASIAFENPLLSADWRRDLGLVNPGDTANVTILRRNVEGGGRRSDIRHTSFRTTVGVKGEFAKFWNYDAFLQTGQVIFQNLSTNDFSRIRAARALDVVAGANGQAVCRSVVDGSDTTCVPYNIWKLGGVTPAALAYIQIPGLQKGGTSQTIQGGNIGADLGNYGWKLPDAKNGVGVSFGVERRVEKLTLNSDVAFNTGDLFGTGSTTPDTDGQYTVSEAFGEIRVPIIEGKPFAELLSLNASYRTSDYTGGSKTDSYGLGIEWAPTKAVRTRASYQQAVAAANIVQLFAPQSSGLFGLNADPCGQTRTATQAQCANTGLPANLYGTNLDSPAQQYNQIFGGNPNLQPETSKSYTAGIVLTPWKNFSATVDYFNISVDKTIGTAPASTILQQCLSTGNPAFCSRITRDSQGTLWLLQSAGIVSTNQNLGTLDTSGFDIGMNYKHKLPSYGSLDFALNGTLTKEFIFEPIPGLGSYDCVGYHGATCGAPQSKWRHKLRTTWETPWNFDVALTWRFFGKVDVDTLSPNPLLSGTAFPADQTLPRHNLFDLAASWTINKMMTLRGGINNIADKDPPISGQVGAVFGNGNTYPQVYDSFGRKFFFNFTVKF